MSLASYLESRSSLAPPPPAVPQEFQLSITPVEGDTYWLRTEAVASGVPLAEARVTWPLETWLAQAATLFHDPLQALLANPAAAPPSSAPWKTLGQALYGGLFQGRIRDSWVAAQSVAQNRRQPLRLGLEFKDSRLQRLPWELLYDGDRPLATGLDVTLCRYYQGQTITDLATMPPLAPATVPVRVLVVIAAPSDQERLALRQEVQRLVESLQQGPVEASTLALDITILEQPGRSELVQALEQGQFQVVHYAGHSDGGSAGEIGGSLFLVNRQNGLSEKLSGNDLAGLLVNNGIRLAVFNSCRGAYTPQDDAQAGWLDQNLVHALVNRGVPGVIAMADRIPDDVALTFTQLLYRNLHQGHPIDLCLSRVRQGLVSAYSSSQPFWTLPLLYLRPDFDGYLYARTAEENDDLAALVGETSEVALLAPDYSADPDLADLAAEILTPLGDRPLPPASPASPASPLYDWLQSLEPAAATAESDTHLASLVQQLSQPPGNAPPAPGAEVAAMTPLPIPHPPPAPGADGVGTLPSPAAPGPIAPSPPALGQRFKTLPLRPLAWAAGLAALGLVAALAIATLSRVNRSAPVAVDVPPAIDLGPTQPPRSSSAQLEGAIGSLALGNTQTARLLIEQMLDRSDFETAANALAAVPVPLIGDPDIAFARGRLLWQQVNTRRNPDASLFDARREWLTATEKRPEFVAAWVALGFAHYAVGDYGGAIAAWEEAIDRDRRHLRDIAPGPGPQVADQIVTHAYAGLAMAHRQEGAITLRPDERLPWDRAAQAYLRQALELNPALVSSNALAAQWLWSPALIADWQTTLAQLADGNAGATLPATDQEQGN